MRDIVESAIAEMAASYKPDGYVGLAKALDRRPTVFFNQFSFQEGHQPGVNTLRAAMRVSGQRGPLFALCHDFGYGAVALGDYRDCSDEELLECLLAGGAARGEVDAEIRRALQDGRITKAEAQKIRQRVSEAIRADLELLSRIDALAMAEEEVAERRALRAVGG
ncbi:phage regulatory CII family protein [Thiococcus pfennigii]|uniref:phage regulatory CII family protein n=1 Tax=Thiococcus pfennigii TaxID=1057 RepID=UPI001903969E|nr:phage regulatory CII family protein [Thiococcus pfennigii]MBK1699764.1 hypothetical protein [Thiococcus pfennigii]